MDLRNTKIEIAPAQTLPEGKWGFWWSLKETLPGRVEIVHRAEGPFETFTLAIRDLNNTLGGV